jgi:serine/threonine-protein kinase
MPIPTPEERVGADLAGKYRLERILARGGMATIYRGVHAWTERRVAVKILHHEFARDEEIVRRFLQEARATSQLRHPNVVDVLDMGQDEERTVYLVMELLEGETLRQRLRRGVLTLDEISTFILPLLRGVALAHQRGVVHRDLKPDNLFLSRDGEHLLPKVLDFGVAKLAGGEASSTRTGTVLGTPQYMAPEQVRGERDVGPTADVWSMGVVLFLALSGRLPFEAETPGGVMSKVLVESAPALRSAAPDVPDAVAAVVDRALSRAPAARFADMGAMLGALEEALTGVVSGPRAVDRGAARVDANETVLVAGASDAVAAPQRALAAAGARWRPMTWAALALATFAVVALATLAIGRSGTAATPLAPVAAPSPAPGPSSAPTATVPAAATPAPAPVETASETASSVEPEGAAAAEPEGTAAVEPADRPGTPGDADHEDIAPTTFAEDDSAGAAGDPARPGSRPVRGPRRGTRGALILH